MQDWVNKLDAFLKFNEEAILKDAGKVTNEVALILAEKEFKNFRIIQDKNYESDFDKKQNLTESMEKAEHDLDMAVKKLEEKKKKK